MIAPVAGALGTGGRAKTVAERLARLLERVAEAGGGDDAGFKHALLAERARALATPRAGHDEAAAADLMGVLVFGIGDERLAMPLASIIAISRSVVVSPLPRAIAPVYGVTAWRGRPLTVLTLASVAETATSQDAEARLIVLGDERRAAVGLLVHSVDETRVIARSKLSPPHAGARHAMSLGVTDDAVLVLDADAVLDAARSEP